MSAFARLIGILWFLILALSCVILSIWCFIYSARLSGQAVLIVIGMSFLMALLIFGLLLIIEIRKPLFKVHTQLMKELTKNGYSQHFLDLAELGKSLYKGTDVELNYYKNIALYGGEGYIINEKYDKAIEFLSSIDLEKLKDSKNIEADKGASLISYFVIQMELCRAIEDKERASKVARDAKPYLDEYYNLSDNIRMLIDEFYILYYYIYQDYTLAIEHAQKVIDNPFHVSHKLIGGYLNMAAAYNKIGDQAKVTEYMDIASNILNETKKALSRQSYELTKKQMSEGNIN